MSDNSAPGWGSIIAVLAILLALSQCNGPHMGERCYDADPTAFHDIVCE